MFSRFLLQNVRSMQHSFRPLDGIENGSIPPLCNIYYAKAGALCYNETNTVFQSVYDD